MADNLDTLSNAELRQKMIEQGLPNIPVTDSSRKVLVKRIRASIGGNALPAATASPKKTGRRETLNVAATVPTAVKATENVRDVNDDVAKARRTIAATPSDSNDANRRRQQLSLTKTAVVSVTRQPEPAPEVSRKPPAAVTTAAPIQTRRSSTSANVERQETVTARPAKKYETIEEESVDSKHVRKENTLLADSLIVLESDEEEDEQLAQAAFHYEEQHKRKDIKYTEPKYKNIISSSSEYVNKPLHTAPVTLSSTYQEQQRRNPIEKMTPAYSLAPTSSAPTFNLGSTASSTRPQNIASTTAYDHVSLSSSGRYSSYIGSPSQSIPVHSARTAPAPSSMYSRPLPQTYTNEFSDDTEAEDNFNKQDSHFESDFARNLARLRSERLGDRSSPYTRRTMASTGVGIEPAGRRSLRPEEVSVSTAFNRWYQSLNRKYNLAPKLFIIAVVVILFAIYRFYN